MGVWKGGVESVRVGLSEGGGKFMSGVSKMEGVWIWMLGA